MLKSYTNIDIYDLSVDPIDISRKGGDKPVKPDPTYVLDCTNAIRGISLVMEWAATREVNPYPRAGYMRYSPEVYRAAMMRHFLAIQAGELIDPESNLPHIYHMAADAVIWAELTTLRNNDGDSTNE